MSLEPPQGVDLEALRAKRPPPPKYPLPPPAQVSPFIRFCRWGFLVAGIAWGYSRYNVLKRREDRHQQFIAEHKAEWDAEMEARAKAKDREGLLDLARDAGIPIPEDFDQQYPPLPEKYVGNEPKPAHH